MVRTFLNVKNEFIQFLEVRESSNKRNLVLYGSGPLADWVMDQIELNSWISPIAICDSDDKKWGLEYRGRLIESFEDIYTRYPDLEVIIAIDNGIHANKINNDLKQFISEKKMFSFCMGYHNIVQGFDFLEDPDLKNWVLYGCGHLSSYIIKKIKEIDGLMPIAVCDSDSSKWGSEYNGRLIESFEEVYKKYPDLKVFVCMYSLAGIGEVVSYLENFIPQERIGKAYKYAHSGDDIPSTTHAHKQFISTHELELDEVYNSLNDEYSKKIFENRLKLPITYNNEHNNSIFFTENSYFPEFIQLSENEIFVDCGAYIGDTFLDYYEKTNGKFKRYYGFEPVQAHFDKLVQNSEIAKERVHLFQQGVFDSDEILPFNENVEPACEYITKNGENKIAVVSLDNHINEEVTFIKMDIEGAELAALKGAEKIIKKYKPKLAICIYHKTEDIFEIPKYIMSLGLDYKYFIRHHSPDHFSETVFYAV